MSRHHIVGSEAFDRSPYVHIRNVGRRRAKPVAVAATAGIGAAALGAMGFLAYALTQLAGVFF